MYPLSILGVVHRISLAYPDHESHLDLLCLRQPQLLELLGSHRHQVVVGHAPELVALEAEILHSDRSVAVVWNHPRAPRAEILDPPDLDARLMDVDPVVGEQVLAIDHE